MKNKLCKQNVYWDAKKEKYAVLISPGWGAGWSTWSQHDSLAWDKDVVKYVIDHIKKDKKWPIKAKSDFLRKSGPSKEQKEFEGFLVSHGYKDVYLGGLGGIEAVWVDKNTRWYIDENDGWESLVLDTEVEDSWNHL